MTDINHSDKIKNEWRNLNQYFSLYNVMYKYHHIFNYLFISADEDVACIKNLLLTE